MKRMESSFVQCSLLAALVLCTVPSCDRSAAVEHLNSPETTARNLPFSEAVRVGDTIYLSGQLGTVPGELKLVDGGIEAETKQALENIRATLSRGGLGMKDVVKCTVYMADIAEWPKMNMVYKTYFSSPYPARSAVAGSGLALGARVEIECMAVRR
jgi:2-iminobutanoate/2-iminopropanoate deaminase